jgi:hypothetical protein
MTLKTKYRISIIGDVAYKASMLAGFCGAVYILAVGLAHYL